MISTFEMEYVNIWFVHSTYSVSRQVVSMKVSYKDDQITLDIVYIIPNWASWIFSFRRYFFQTGNNFLGAKQIYHTLANGRYLKVDGIVLTNKSDILLLAPSGCVVTILLLYVPEDYASDKSSFPLYSWNTSPKWMHYK